MTWNILLHLTDEQGIQRHSGDYRATFWAVSFETQMCLHAFNPFREISDWESGCIKSHIAGE